MRAARIPADFFSTRPANLLDKYWQVHTGNVGNRLIDISSTSRTVLQQFSHMDLNRQGLSVELATHITDCSLAGERELEVDH